MTGCRGAEGDPGRGFPSALTQEMLYAMMVQVRRRIKYGAGGTG